MEVQVPSIELAQGDLAQNTRACRRWFKPVAWALERHPDGLFANELKAEYRVLCELQGIEAPYTDDGDFHDSLTRQIQIVLAICHEIGWLSYRFERPTRAYPVPHKRGTARLPPLIPEPLWTLTKAGKRANGWSENKLTRSIAWFLLKRGVQPTVRKVRVPLAVASGAIGLAKIVSGWGELQAMVEGLIVIAGAFVLSLLRSADSQP